MLFGHIMYLLSYKTFFQLSIKFQLLIKNKMLKNTQIVLAIKLSDVVFILLINVKMPTIVGILTYMSMDKVCAQLS